MKSFTFLLSLLLLIGCIPSKDTDSNYSKNQKNHYSLIVDSSYSTYTAMQAGEGSDWVQLSNTLQTVQLAVETPHFNLVQQCGDASQSILEVKHLFIQEDYEINIELCRLFQSMATDENKEQKALAIIEPSSNDYKIINAASANGNRIYLNENNDVILRLNSPTEKLSLAIISKRLSDNSYHLFFKPNSAYSADGTHSIDFDLEGFSYPLSLVSNSAFTDGKYSPSLLINDYLDLGLYDEWRMQRDFYFSLSTSIKNLPFSYHYIHKFWPSSDIQITKYDYSVINPQEYLATLPPNLKWPASRRGLEGSIMLSEFDHSQIESGLYLEQLHAMWSDYSGGTPIILEIDSQRLKHPNLIELPDLSGLPNLENYREDVMLFPLEGVFLMLSNRKGTEPGATHVQVEVGVEI